MASNGWQWSVSSTDQQHSERVALLREIPYELTTLPGEEEFLGQQEGVDRQGKALSLNISSGGMLLLMEWAPVPERVLRVHVPTPVSLARTPTLAEVRWIRRVPFTAQDGPYFVGLKFLF